MSWLSAGLSVRMLSSLSSLTNFIIGLGRGTVSTDVITGLSPKMNDIIGVLESAAESLFPTVAPELRAAVAAATMFNPNLTMWLQGFLNAELNTNLVVDGIYGPATAAAVKQLQVKLGLNPDGWFGQITAAAVSKAFTNVSVPAVPAVVASGA